MHDVGVANGSNFLEKLPAAMLRLRWSPKVEFELWLYVTTPIQGRQFCPSLFSTGTITSDRSLQSVGTLESDVRALDYSASGV